MEEKPLKPIIESIFERLSNPEGQKKNKLLDYWPQVAGAQISKHTKARFTSHKQVTVWVDDSTLAFELSQRYKFGILKQLQNLFGEGEVKDVKFFVGELR
ncbi:MAG: hypothetical protein A3G87_04720 [Omnitrophica bacterium RIFCSPLOWO2_12_FULL_50_11]|nr:MAG: hypothetical protein A3G87_04720 [Omnitrophica bacterium RIFCSPLOWO2_12_FULL_50_11]